MSEEKKIDTNASAEPAEPIADAKGPAGAPLKGMLGDKIGMTRIFLDDNRMVPVTVIQSDGCVVTQIKTTKKEGYNAVQIGVGDTKPEKLSKPELQHLGKNGISPKRWLKEFRVNDATPF